MIIKLAITVLVLSFTAFGQQQPPAKATPPEVIQATKEQILEYALTLTQIESARNRAEALRANAVLADLQADKQEQGKKAMLDGFMRALGVDPEKYEVNIDERQSRIFFTLKKQQGSEAKPK